MKLTCRHFSILIWWLMYECSCLLYICLVQMITVTLLFGERLLLANEFFHWQDFTQRSPAKWEKMFPLISCRVIHDFKASNELITQPLYQSIVIRYVESCKHTFSRNFFARVLFTIFLYGLRAPQHPLITQSRLLQLYFGSYPCFVTCCFGQRWWL